MILITGATGFVGKAVTRALLDKKPRLLSRDPGKIPAEWRGHVQAVQGDLRDREALREALKGISTVYHLAGEVRDEKNFWAVNAEGTRILLEESAAAGVSTFFYLSSVGVIGARGEGVIGENEPCDPKNEYERSKYEGERSALQFGREGKFKVVAGRPTIVFGEGKRGKDSLLEWLKMIQRGRFVYIGGRGMANYVYIEDVADACVRLAENAQGTAEICHISDSVPVTRFVESAAKVLGVNPPNITLPVWPARIAASILECGKKFLGTPAPLTAARVAALSASLSFSSKRLQEFYGIKPLMGFEKGLERTIRWYRREGLLS